jgi:hypothetical protein
MAPISHFLHHALFAFIDIKNFTLLFFSDKNLPLGEGEEDTRKEAFSRV